MQQAGTVSLNGLSMYYEIHGAGQPLILLHGAFGTIESCFGALLPRLASNRQVVAVELQAHGRTPDIDRPLTYEALASDIKGLVDHLGYERVDLVGYSLGGGVAIEVAMRYPSIVRRVVFVGGPTFSPGGIHPEIAEGFTIEQPEDSAAHQLEDSIWHHAFVGPELVGVDQTIPQRAAGISTGIRHVSPSCRPRTSHGGKVGHSQAGKLEPFSTLRMITDMGLG